MSVRLHLFAFQTRCVLQNRVICREKEILKGKKVQHPVYPELQKGERNPFSPSLFFLGQKRRKLFPNGHKRRISFFSPFVERKMLLRARGRSSFYPLFGRSEKRESKATPSIPPQLRSEQPLISTYLDLPTSPLFDVGDFPIQLLTHNKLCLFHQGKKSHKIVHFFFHYFSQKNVFLSACHFCPLVRFSSPSSHFLPLHLERAAVSVRSIVSSGDLISSFKRAPLAISPPPGESSVSLVLSPIRRLRSFGHFPANVCFKMTGFRFVWALSG